MRLRRDDLSWRELDGEMVVLDLRASTYLRTNGSGAYLFGQLVEERERDELVAGLVDRYTIDRDRARADVDAFLTMLGERGLLDAGGS